MGTLKVNGDISATSNISASSFIGTLNGNALTATNSSKLGNYSATEYFRRGSNITTSCNDATTSRSYWATDTATDKPSIWGGLIDFNTGSHHQLFFSYGGNDTYVGLHTRAKVNGVWQPWSTFLNENNYTDYTVTKTGSGASGTWGINVTGSAGSVTWGNITGKPSTFTPSSHTHNTLTAGGEGSTANKRYNNYNCAVLSGGWADSNAGYSSTYGTTLDISGYSSWYHRLAFNTNGIIEYWQGINTETMSKVGNLCFSNHTHSYLPLSGGTMSGNSVIKFPASAGSIAASDPMAITYGRISAYSTLCINADTDVSGGEYIILTAGKGLSSSIADGLAIGQSTLTWQGASVITSGNIGSQSVNYANSSGYASSANRSTYAGTSWTATCTTKKWRRICYIATDIGTVGTAGILNIRSTRGNYVCNASFMITSAHPAGNSTIIQLGSMWYSTAQIRIVSDINGNFYIEIHDNGDNVDAGIAQTYYCSWLPLTANSITVYTSATSGSNVPSGFSVRSSIAIAAGNYVVGNLITASQYGNDPNSQASILGNIYFKI